MRLILNNCKILLKAVWNIDKRYYLYLCMNILGLSVFTYTSIQVPKLVLVMVESGNINTNQLVILFSTMLASAILAAYSKSLYMPIGSKVRYNYLLQIAKQYMSIPFEMYEDPKIKDDVWTVLRPVSSIDGIQGFYVDLAQLLGNLGVLGIAIGLLFQLELWIAMLIVVWFILYTLLSIRASNKIDKRFNENIHLSREEWYLRDIGVDVAFGKEIRVFRLQSWLQDKISKVSSKIRVFSLANETTQMIPLLLDDTFQFIRDSLVYLVLIPLYFTGDLGIGAFVSFSVLLAQLNRALLMGSESLQRLLSRHESNKNMFDFIDLPTQSNTGLSIKLRRNWKLEFHDVSFKYPNTDHWIYKDLNFTISENQKLAIVGLNGVGKTTLMKLLLRLYEPTSGFITLNGTNINEFKLNEYFELFAPVFQEINLFPFTMRENLSFDHDIDDEHLLDALKKSGLDSHLFNEKLLDTVHLTRYIHQDGLVLSGGQAQKFVTARAYAYQRPIYIFDEPTSALDAVAEYDFYHQIESNMKDKTILFVSHRLASTQFCDVILLIEGQTILEQGSHQDLLAANGRYAQLFKMQAKYYQESI